MLQELMNNPTALPALVGALVVAATQLVLAAVRAGYGLYTARRGAAFSAGLELEVRGRVVGEDGAELLHLVAEARNVGAARVRIEAATVKVSVRSMRGERATIMEESVYGEPKIFAAFPPERVPGLEFVPGQLQRAYKTIELPEGTPLPLRLLMEVWSAEDGWWTEGVAGREIPADNVDEERRFSQ